MFILKKVILMASLFLLVMPYSIVLYSSGFCKHLEKIVL